MRAKPWLFRALTPPGSVAPPSSVSPRAASSPRAPAVTLLALQSVLSGLGLPQAGAAGPSPTASAPLTSAATAEALAQAMRAVAAAGGAGGARAAAPLLSAVLTPDVVLSALREPSVLARLTQYLPESQRDAASVEALVRSAQWASQLEQFSQALQSGRLDLAQFGLSHAAGFSVTDFLAAIQEQAGPGAGEQGGAS